MECYVSDLMADETTDTGRDDVVIVIPRAKLQAAGRKRWKGVPKADRQQFASERAKAYWASLSPKERSAEMKRRAKVRKTRRK